MYKKEPPLDTISTSDTQTSSDTISTSDTIRTLDTISPLDTSRDINYEEIINNIFLQINELTNNYNKKIIKKTSILKSLINYKTCIIKKINLKLMHILLDPTAMDTNTNTEIETIQSINIENYNNLLKMIDEKIDSLTICNINNNENILQPEEELKILDEFTIIYDKLKKEISDILNHSNNKEGLNIIKESITKYNYILSKELIKYINNLSKELIFDIIINILTEIYNLLYFKNLILTYINNDLYYLSNEPNIVLENNKYFYIGSIYDNRYDNEIQKIKNNSEQFLIEDISNFNNPALDKSYILLKKNNNFVERKRANLSNLNNRLFVWLKKPGGKSLKKTRKLRHRRHRKFCKSKRCQKR